MAGRRTNLALCGLLAVSVATGVTAYAVGSGWNRWASAFHGLTGLAILVLVPWKRVIVRRGMVRRRPGWGAAVALGLLVGLSIVVGVLHATGLLVSLGGVTAMQVHVAAAIAAVPLAIWHVVARRVPLHRTDLSRRNLLRAGAVVGSGALAYGWVEVMTVALRLPGDRRRFTGSYETGSFRPGAMPVTQWFNDAVPEVDPSTWNLTISANGRSRTLSYDDLTTAGLETMEATVDCTGGWFARQTWGGVPLERLLGPVEGRSVLVRSVTGYARRFPLRDVPRLFLATRAGDGPLSAGHGFPARLVAPGRRGFWWVKWVTELRVDDTPSWWQSPFPLT